MLARATSAAGTSQMSSSNVEVAASEVLAPLEGPEVQLRTQIPMRRELETVGLGVATLAPAADLDVVCLIGADGSRACRCSDKWGFCARREMGTGQRKGDSGMKAEDWRVRA